MNFPYSKKSWVAVTLAALMVTPGASAWAAETTTPATTSTTSATQAGATAAAEELTIDKAIEVALKNNVTLKNLRIDVDTSSINVRLVHDQVRELPSEFITSLSAAQQKYVQSAKVDLVKKVNDLSLKSAESQIKLGAEKAFYDYINARADLELKKQSLKRAETNLKIAEAAFKVGTRAKTDVLTAQAGVAGAQASLAAAESTAEIKLLELNKFIGAELTKKWTLMNKTHTENVALKVEDAIAEALKNRVEILSKAEELKIAQLDIELIKKYSALSTYPGQLKQNDLEKAQIAIEQTKNDITVEVLQAYHNLNSVKSQIEALKKGKEAAAESFRLTKLRFENGLATSIEVIGAEEELSKSENSLQTAIHNYNLALINYENATGK
ncbi:TolC family protein [Brevibacillus dissolubilis]|uniref:TolC family protein n=1 Tax=Brevibacillus dissolubilis TaxID=1844116 RepID=UPI0011171E9B|nr:TolC family protein [Brevibacillus dissolubilis]